MAYQKVSQGVLYYEAYGQGESLLLLHGSLSNGEETFRRQITAFSDGYRCLVPDLMNHGKSQKNTGSWTTETLAEDMAEFLTTQGVNAAHVVGHSMGGDVAMYLTVKYPEKVRSLVLLSDGLRMNKPIIRYLNNLKPAFLAKLQMEYGAYGKRLLQQTIWNCANYPNFTKAELQQVKIPVLLIYGGKDDKVLATEISYLQQNLPDFHCYCYAVGDHFLHGRKESCEIVNQEMLKFLRRVK